ncbi:hypothetical protein [Pseudoroseomonas ludipueritiae]|uniref:Uncharacterized protein n=1 Tax=Pseudoroseomonas ludipueritiae TaxID=198093 RepID=A0ABR7RFG0_9PROT|nr:hypothetical protein [Pseudoroseomonas ludipueritiae]MBC9180165.1 hypothetical protein [Pseudoroseomonas ludipueritiae]
MSTPAIPPDSKPDHERIWLSPRDPFEERTWCQDNVWADIPECADDPPTEYVRADLVAAAVAQARADAREHALREAASEAFGLLYPTNPKPDWTRYAHEKADHAIRVRMAILSLIHPTPSTEPGHGE